MAGCNGNPTKQWHVVSPARMKWRNRNGTGDTVYERHEKKRISECNYKQLSQVMDSVRMI